MSQFSSICPNVSSSVISAHKVSSNSGRPESNSERPESNSERPESNPKGTAGPKSVVIVAIMTASFHDAPVS